MAAGTIPTLKLVVWGPPKGGKTKLLDRLFDSLVPLEPGKWAISRDEDASGLFYGLGKDHYVWQMSVPRRTDRPRFNVSFKGSKEYHPFLFKLEIFETTDPLASILSSNISNGRELRIVFLALDASQFTPAGRMNAPAPAPQSTWAVAQAAPQATPQTAPPPASPASQPISLPPAEPVGEDDVDLSEFVPLTDFFRTNKSFSAEDAPEEAQANAAQAEEQALQAEEPVPHPQIPLTESPPAAFESPYKAAPEMASPPSQPSGISSSEFAAQVKQVLAWAYSSRQIVLVFLTKCDLLSASLRYLPARELARAVFGEEMVSALRAIKDGMLFVSPGQGANASGGSAGAGFPSGGLQPVLHTFNAFVGTYDDYPRENPPFPQEAQ
jgi:hypothetical protein